MRSRQRSKFRGRTESKAARRRDALAEELAQSIKFTVIIGDPTREDMEGATDLFEAVLEEGRTGCLTLKEGGVLTAEGATYLQNLTQGGDFK